MIVFALSQLSEREDMVFRGLLIPVGLIIAWTGIRAVRNRKFHLRKWKDPVTGPLAIVLGTLVAVTGLVFSVVAAASFLSR